MFRLPMRLLLAGLLLFTFPASTTAAPLVIDDITTRTRYQYPGTSAIVDVQQHHIRLPAWSVGPGLLDTRPHGYDLVTISGDALLAFSFDGERMVLNPTLSITPPESPVAVSARSSPTGLTAIVGRHLLQYAFNGEALVQVPQLTAAFPAPVHVASRLGDTTLYALAGGALSAYAWDGEDLVLNPALSIPAGQDALAVAVRPDSRDTVLLLGEQATYYAFDGDALVALPHFDITGLVSPVALQFAADGTLYTVDDAGVTAWSPDGAGWTLNPLLSIPEAVGAVAVAPFSDARSIAVRFADEIRVYQFDGERMRENPALRITGLQMPSSAEGTQYAPAAVALSQVYAAPEPVEALVLYARQDVPPGTAVVYQVSHDAGTTWHDAVLGRGVLFPSPDDSGAAWRAILSTTDPSVTPRILPNIELHQIWPPDAPSQLRVSPTDATGTVTSLTPTLSWRFTDRDQPDDYQTAFQIQLFDDSGRLVFNSGKISVLSDASMPPDEPGPYPLSAPDPRGSQSHYTLPPGALSSGHHYSWRVRVWDRYDLPSSWSSATHFDVLALDHLQILDVWMPPPGLPELPTSAVPVPVLAGAQFAFSVDSRGPITAVTALFSDGGTVELTPQAPPGSPGNTWVGTYFTDGTTPVGTLITATFTGWTADGRAVTLTSPVVVIEGSVYDRYWIILTN